jgi:hypothetical protein
MRMNGNIAAATAFIRSLRRNDCLSVPRHPCVSKPPAMRLFVIAKGECLFVPSYRVPGRVTRWEIARGGLKLT